MVAPLGNQTHIEGSRGVIILSSQATLGQPPSAIAATE